MQVIAFYDNTSKVFPDIESAADFFCVGVKRVRHCIETGQRWRCVTYDELDSEYIGEQPAIYISGKITGVANYKERFVKAEKYLRTNYPQAEIFNPATIQFYGGDKSWADYMKYDLERLLKCDTIYMLTNWKTSKGAKLEKRIAEELGFKVIYEQKN